jgi:thiamine pyrophosphate-dependent acetolactate synthase large subunit-like protein
MTRKTVAELLVDVLAEAGVERVYGVPGGSCRPGYMHLIDGLYDCQRSRVPVLAIAAQIPNDSRILSTSV